MIKREEFLSWLSSRKSGQLRGEFADLFRFGELIGLLIAANAKAQNPDNEKAYEQLFYDLAQRLSIRLRCVHTKLTRSPIRFANDEIVDLAWRSLVLCINEATAISDWIPSSPMSEGLILPVSPNIASKEPYSVGTRRICPELLSDNHINESVSSSTSTESSAFLNPASVEVPAEPKTIMLAELTETIHSLLQLIDLIIEHFNLVNSWCTSSPKLNRLGLSEIQLDILQALYPDNLLSAATISEKLGIPPNEKGAVSFLGQLKPEATLRRLGLLGTQRGVEGGYFLLDKGRQVFEEYSGLDQTGLKKNRVDDTWVSGGLIREQESERNLAELFGPSKFDEAIASKSSAIDRREKTSGQSVGETR
ncbi:hypothetical protein FGO68_gene13545 [Halteria grandinella]|uniref:Uncharacterized protein n=1 Tax=Halteria grandinella TaxID=5974 RepID=A0A8J8NAG9_HALGN|nr:hypothetical protein FGO68_gene13545 [Halteria grandinella]